MFDQWTAGHLPWRPPATMGGLARRCPHRQLLQARRRLPAIRPRRVRAQCILDESSPIWIPPGWKDISAAQWRVHLFGESPLVDALSLSTVDPRQRLLGKLRRVELLDREIADNSALLERLPSRVENRRKHRQQQASATDSPRPNNQMWGEPSSSTRRSDF